MILILISLLSAFLAIYFLPRVDSRSRLPLPPGPPGALPLIGHLFVLPKSHEWLTYLHWSSKLGSDIICLNVVGEHVVILNSLKAAKDLFEGRMALYSDRPRLFVLRKILGFHWVYGLLPYGKAFLEVRKAANKFLNHASIKDYHLLQQSCARKCLSNLLKCPDDFLEHFRETAGGAILGAAYGIQPQAGDPYMQMVFMAGEGLNLGLSTHALLYDLFPVVQWLPDWFPGLGLQNEAQKFISHVAELPVHPLRQTRTAMENNTAVHSIAASMLADKTLGDDVIQSLTGSMYLAGSETTVATLTNFLLAMIKNPEAQQKAQAELDTVVGEGRLPDFRDESSLPYVNALVKEVMRWRTVTPLATPHRLTKDDTYNGYFLPKGSIVIGNAFAIMHDEVSFCDPDLFIPERYLDPSTKSLDFMFGFGSRICPGRFFARSTVWITVVSILATFVVSKAIDDEGNEIGVSDQEFTSGVVSFPVPFKCHILPRSRAARELIHSEI